MSYTLPRLERHFITKVDLEAAPDAVRHEFASAYVIVCSAHFSRYSKEGNGFGCSLSLEMRALPGQEKAVAPYRVEVTVRGHFRIDEVQPAGSEVDDQFKTASLGALYGKIKELVRDLTSEGPWPQVDLPPIEFRDLSPVSDEDEPIMVPTRERQGMAIA